jgi:hypothetical protein
VYTIISKELHTNRCAFPASFIDIHQPLIQKFISRIIKRR